MNFRFTPDQRIRNRSGFDAVYATRRSRRAGPLLVFVRRCTGEFGPRLGLSLPKRVGSAVVRNRMKRRFRELLRAALLGDGLPDHDHVLIGRSGGVERDFQTMAQELDVALERAANGWGDPRRARRGPRGNRTNGATK